MEQESSLARRDPNWERMWMYRALQQGALYLRSREVRERGDWGSLIPVESVDKIIASAELVTFVVGDSAYSYDIDGPSFLRRLAGYGYEYAQTDHIVYCPI